MKTIILLAFAALMGLTAHAQSSQGFELTVKIHDYPEGELLRLGRYHAEGQFLLDTATFDARRGVFVFKRDEPLQAGMYMLVCFESTPVDIIVEHTQQFSMEINYPFNATNVAAARYTNSPENQVFSEFNDKVRPFFTSLNQWRRDFDSLADKQSPEGEALTQKMQETWRTLEGIRNQFIEDNPKHLMTAVFRALQDIEVPEAPDDIPESERNLWRYNYWTHNYFRNMDFSSDRLLRTPHTPNMPGSVFNLRMETYLSRVLSQHPDSLKFGVARLFELTRESPELFQYTVATLVSRYLQSQIIGYDAIWVYLIERYYLSGDAVWASEATIESFKAHVERHKPLLIGSRPTEFFCPDTNADRSNERFRSVFEPTTRYTIVIFWEPSCGHCRRQMPILRDFYNTKRKELDFEVFAVCHGCPDVDAWRAYLRDNEITHWINVNGKASNVQYNELWDVNSSPTIYVLDSHKRIVTKRIEVDQIEPFIQNWNALHYND